MSGSAHKPFAVSRRYWFSMPRRERRDAWREWAHGSAGHRDLFGLEPFIDRSSVVGSRGCRCESCADVRAGRMVDWDIEAVPT